jgi:hypothetical protein
MNMGIQLDNTWKKRNILKCATWNIQGISYKEDQLDDILAKEKCKNSSYIRD